MDLTYHRYHLPHLNRSPQTKPTYLKPTSKAIQIPIWELFEFPTGQNDIQYAGTFLKSGGVDIWTTFISRTKEPDTYFALFRSGLALTEWNRDFNDENALLKVLQGINGAKEVFVVRSESDVAENYWWVQDNIPDNEGWDTIMFAYHNYRVREYAYQHRVILSKDTVVTFDMGIEAWRY